MNDDGRQTSHPSCARRFHALSPAHRSRIAHHYAHHALNGTTRAQMDELVVLLCDERRFRPGSRTQAKAAAAALAQCFRNMGFPDTVTDWGAANAAIARETVSKMVGTAQRDSQHATTRMAVPEIQMPDCTCTDNRTVAGWTATLPPVVQQNVRDDVAAQCHERAHRLTQLLADPGGTCAFLRTTPFRQLASPPTSRATAVAPNVAADQACWAPNELRSEEVGAPS